MRSYDLCFIRPVIGGHVMNMHVIQIIHHVCVDDNNKVKVYLPTVNIEKFKKDFNFIY